MIEKKQTNQQILEKALNKAVLNGFEGGASWKAEMIIEDSEFVRRFAPILIFNHGFAKALWGDGKLSGETVMDGQEYEITLGGGLHKYLPKKNWQYHLQQMVIADDPIGYLGNNS